MTEVLVATCCRVFELGIRLTLTFTVVYLYDLTLMCFLLDLSDFYFYGSGEYAPPNSLSS